MAEEQIKKSPKSIFRSVAYPAISLEDAIESMTELRKNLGPTGKYSRESAIQGLGYSSVSGASSRRVAALVHYGLLTRVGSAYQASPLSDAIFMERSLEEKQQAKLEAFKAPALFRTLLERYDGAALPQMFAHVLSREYKINPKVASDVVDIFRKSAEYAGVLVNGIINTSVTTHEDLSNQTKEGERLLHQEESSDLHSSSHSRNVRYGYNDMIDDTLDSGIIILFPKEYKKALHRGEFAAALTAFEEATEKILPQHVDPLPASEAIEQGEEE